MNALQDLQRDAREYESQRDRYKARGGDAAEYERLVIAARKVADTAVRFLADRRRRRQKENTRQGIGPDDVKRLRIAARKAVR